MVAFVVLSQSCSICAEMDELTDTQQGSEAHSNETDAAERWRRSKMKQVAKES